MKKRKKKMVKWFSDADFHIPVYKQKKSKKKRKTEEEITDCGVAMFI